LTIPTLILCPDLSRVSSYAEDNCMLHCGDSPAALGSQPTLICRTGPLYWNVSAKGFAGKFYL
jgi:hypothetical protein